MLVPMEPSTAPRHVLGRAAPVATGRRRIGLETAVVLETHGTLGLSSSAKRHSGHVLSHFVLCAASRECETAAGVSSNSILVQLER